MGIYERNLRTLETCQRRWETPPDDDDVYFCECCGTDDNNLHDIDCNNRVLEEN